MPKGKVSIEIIVSILFGGFPTHLAKILVFVTWKQVQRGMHLDHSMHPFLTVIESFRMQKDGDFS